MGSVAKVFVQHTYILANYKQDSIVRITNYPQNTLQNASLPKYTSFDSSKQAVQLILRACSAWFVSFSPQISRNIEVSVAVKQLKSKQFTNPNTVLSAGTIKSMQAFRVSVHILAGVVGERICRPRSPVKQLSIVLYIARETFASNLTERY